MFSRLSKQQRNQNPRAKAQKNLRRLKVEYLEDRVVPAGSVTVAVTGGGGLTVTGDSGNNQIQIAETATPGSYIITGQTNGAGTTIVAGTGVTVNNTNPNNVTGTITGITSMVVNMGAGNDVVNFVGNTAANTTLTGNLLVTNSGGLQVRFDAANGNNGFNVQGTTEITHTGTSSPLVVNVGNGGNTSTQTALVGGLIITGGTENQNVTIRGRSTLGFFSDNVTGGNDTVRITNATIDDFFSYVSTGTGNDNVLIGTAGGAATNIGGNVAIDTGTAGNEVISIGTNGPVTIGGTAIITGAGSGTQNITTGTGAGNNQTVIVAGGLSINEDTTTGVNTINLRNLGATFLSVLTGTNNDNVQLLTDRITDQVAIFLGLGNDVLGINNSLFTGTFLPPASTLLGVVDIEGQGGNDAFNIGTTNNAGFTTKFSGSFFLSGGVGNDTLNIGTASAQVVQFSNIASFYASDYPSTTGETDVLGAKGANVAFFGPHAGTGNWAGVSAF